MKPIWLVAPSNAVVEMPALIGALSKDPAVLSLTVTAVLLLIKSIETLEFLASNDVCIEVSKLDDIRLECGICVSTPVVDKL
jgi:hypothetical protein